MKKNKPTHGGKREGAGRPKQKEQTVVMRIPKSLVVKVKAIIKEASKASLPSQGQAPSATSARA